MDEIWERAVETALDGEPDHAAVRNLTLDGAVKCVHGRLPHPSVFERFPNLQHLSLANIGVSSLEQFPRLGNLQKLVLSDNRIAGGLECLVDAGLKSLVDLDLSNNRIQFIEDLAPLADFQLVSLDLYECPVTRVKDYRSRVFGLIKSLKYLDKMDSEENETPETDDEEEEDEEEEEDDPGSGEVDGGNKLFRKDNGHNSLVDEGILDVDEEEDEESDADEEETETERNGQSSHHESNGFQLARADKIGDEEDNDEIEVEDSSSGEEIDEEDADDDDEVVEVHEVADSGDEDDRLEFDEEDEEVDGDEDDDEEEVDNEERDMGLPSSTGQLASTEGEIDGHEQGEDDAFEDDNGETGEEDEQGVEEEVGYEEEDGEDEDDDDDEENGSGYLVQPVNQQAIADEVDDDLGGGSDMEPVNDEEDEEDDNEDLFGEEDVEDDLQDDHQVGQFQMPPSSSSSHFKRKRSNEDDEDEESSDSGNDDDDNDNDDGGGGGVGRLAKMPKNVV